MATPEKNAINLGMVMVINIKPLEPPQILTWYAGGDPWEGRQQSWYGDGY